VRNFQVGDRVIVAAHGTAKPARVVLASPNGGALMVEFDGGLFVDGGAAYVGMMPVLRHDDGGFIELINATPIAITADG